MDLPRTCLILACLCFWLVECVEHYLMQSWNLYRSDNPKEVYTNITIPTYVHLELLSRDIIDDPYFGFNDLNYRWIPESNWTFWLEFDVGFGTEADDNNLFLVFEGIDTVASVTLNGISLGATDNQFRSWVFPVDSLSSSGNLLSVEIASPVDYGAIRAKQYPYLVPQVCPVESYRGFCYFNFIRKDASSFSWDWGPGFAPQGLWKPVYVRVVSKKDMPIKGVSINLFKSASRWTVNTSVFSLNTSFPGSFIKHCSDSLLITFSINALDLQMQSKAAWSSDGNRMTASFFVPEELPVKLWWPNGFGMSNMYNATFELSCPAYKSSFYTTKIGFREVELVQDPIFAQNSTQAGNSFYFKINGVPIFAKGTNWIPPDAFQTRVSKEKLRYLLNSVKIANMNMLRVWGGGVYESDEFYDITDELGIMVWQDMMFACSLYPVDDLFLYNVEMEVKEQIYRLRGHPSVVIWAGNNENEAALSQNWWSVPESSLPQFKADYVKLYVHTIQNVVTDIDNYRPYITSSPSNGIESIAEGYVSSNPYSDFYGDTHFYDYNTDCFELSHYPITRFASEYGFQSWPFYSTIKKASSEQEVQLDSTWFNERNHHPSGNEEILSNMNRHFGYKFPTLSNTSTDFDWFAYLSQLENALCIKTETEHYLKYQNVIDASGRGNTMGAMYWQLNDIWQAPTWASIDYYGKWKILHNYAFLFFESVHVFAQYDLTSKDVSVFVSSNLRESFEAELHVLLLSVKSGKQVKSSSSYHNISSNSASWLGQIEVSEFTEGTECASETLFCYIYLQLLRDSQVITTNEVYFEGFDNKSTLPCATVELEGYNLNSSDGMVANVSVQLRVSKVALFFWIDHEPKFIGLWIDNGRHLADNYERKPSDEVLVSREFIFYKPVVADKVSEFISGLKFFYLNSHPNCI